MKKVTTFAERAKKIQKKYPYADKVSADKQALDSELLNLFQEQEMYKQSNGVQTSDNMAATGGPFGANHFRIPSSLDEAKKYTDPLDWMDLEFNRPVDDIFKTWDTPSKSGLAFGNPDTPIPSGITEQEFADSDYKRDGWQALLSKIKTPSGMNIASGVASGVGNLSNMLSTKDPRRIDPHTVSPTFSFQESDLTPYMTALDKELASTRYSFLESGADFDTASTGIIKANDQFATNRGKMFLEQSRLNQAEAKRGDEIINQSLYFNAQSENQADIDQATRQDAVDQLRRDYFAGLSENISNIFKDEADRMLGEELAPYMFQSEAFKAMLKSNKDGE